MEKVRFISKLTKELRVDTPLNQADKVYGAFLWRKKNEKMSALNIHLQKKEKNRESYWL